MPKQRRNRWDLDKCCRWIRRYEQNLLEEELKASDLTKWETRLAELRYEKERDALLLRRRELVRIAELKPLLERIAGGFKIQFQGMGKREAPQIAAGIAKKLSLTTEQTQGLVPMISGRIDEATRSSLQAFSDGVHRFGGNGRSMGHSRKQSRSRKLKEKP